MNYATFTAVQESAAIALRDADAKAKGYPLPPDYVGSNCVALPDSFKFVLYPEPLFSGADATFAYPVIDSTALKAVVAASTTKLADKTIIDAAITAAKVVDSTWFKTVETVTKTSAGDTKPAGETTPK